MKHRRYRSIALLTSALLSVMLALSVCALGAEGSFERALKVTGAVELDVKTGAGSIDVRTGNASSVQVRGTIRASESWRTSFEEIERKVRTLESNPPIEQSGSVIRIGHVQDRELLRHLSISYELVVPVETRLRSSTGSGSQTIEGLRGPVKAETGSGNLRISNVGGEVRADAGSGGIELDSISGYVYADTGSGTIRASGIAGGFVGETGSGDVKLRQDASGSVKIHTGSGSVEVSGVRGSLIAQTGSGSVTAQGEPVGEWKLETGSGSVTARLPSQAAFDLYAHTGSGHITTDHPITVQGKIGRSELRGKVRGGGPLIDLGAGSGNIHIE